MLIWEAAHTRSTLQIPLAPKGRALGYRWRTSPFSFDPAHQTSSMTTPRPDRSRANTLSPAERVRAECLTLARPALKRSALAVGALAAACAGSTAVAGVSLRLIGLWCGIAICGTAIVVFVAGWRDQLDTSGAVSTHQREIVSAAAIAGMAFGSGAWLLFDANGAAAGSKAGGSIALTNITVNIAIIAMAAALAIGLQMVPGAAIAVVVCAVAPMVARFGIIQTPTSIGAAVVTAFAAASLVMLMREAAQNQVKLVRNRLENDMLGRRLLKAVELGRAADEELVRLHSTIEETQHRDEITGSFNRRQLNQHLADTWTRANAGFDPFSLAFIEVDRFDTIVSAHGTAVGDECLRQVARIIGANLRTDDVLARLSGAQFAVILQNTMMEGSLVALERIRRGLAASPIDAGEPLIVRANIGVVTYDPDTLPREMLARVDEALVAARDNGGNRITINEAELRNVVAIV